MRLYLNHRLWVLTSRESPYPIHKSHNNPESSVQKAHIHGVRYRRPINRKPSSKGKNEQSNHYRKPHFLFLLIRLRPPHVWNWMSVIFDWVIDNAISYTSSPKLNVKQAATSRRRLCENSELAADYYQVTSHTLSFFLFNLCVFS